MAKKRATKAGNGPGFAQDASGEPSEGFGPHDGPDAGNGRSVSGDPWRNRIVAYGPALVSQVVANPKNWRVHTPDQYAALEGSLGIGIVQNVIINRTTGNLVDGHARVTLALRKGIESVPATFVELSQDEEDKILLALDPIAAMAKADTGQMAALFRDVGEIEAGSMLDLIWDADKRAKIMDGPQPPQEFPDVSEENLRTTYKCPECGYEWSGKPR